MQLKLRRSQRTAGVISRSIMFMLDARLELTEDEAANVHRYGLGDQVIYNSAASRKHLEAAADAAARDTGGSFISQIAQLAMHRLSLNITLDGLVKGQHIECKDIDELLGSEKAIRMAAHSAYAFLAVAKGFDGRDVLVDPATDEEIST
jgi:hypothetical protein